MEATKGRIISSSFTPPFLQSRQWTIPNRKAPAVPADIAVVVLRCLDVGFPLPRKDMFNGITDDRVRIKCVVSTSSRPSDCMFAICSLVLQRRFTVVCVSWKCTLKSFGLKN